MRHLLRALPLVLSFTACRTTESDPNVKAAKAGLKYLALGDSIAFANNPLIEGNAENVQGGALCRLS